MAGYRQRVWAILTPRVFQPYVPDSGTLTDRGSKRSTSRIAGVPVEESVRVQPPTSGDTAISLPMRIRFRSTRPPLLDVPKASQPL